MTKTTTLPPIISLQSARHAWFKYQDSALSVSLCTPDQFRSFITSIAPPSFTDTDARSVLAQHTMDDFDKWFVLSIVEKRLVNATPPRILPLFTDKACIDVLHSKYDISKPRAFTKPLQSKSERVKTKVVQVVDSTTARRPKRVRSESLVHAS